jgi:hypothetical protein
MSNHLLIGSSFVNPIWQDVETWAAQYSKIYPSYIVANPGMGIKGVCTEALYYLEELNDISKVIVMLPDLWKIDIEIDEETYISNSMTDLLWADSAGVVIKQKAHRKWITSGSMVWDKKTEMALIFDFVLKHQGFLVIVKEHFRELKRLIDTCRCKNISCYITAARDPLSELSGLDYIRPQVEKILQDVNYDSWTRFDGKFVNDFLKHNKHPTAQEHTVLCKYIFELTNQEK